jgi:DNA-binding transcriptional LysR family regulator
MQWGNVVMRLPSFSNLIAFDAVARHGTVMRAAVELNVSQPAISRRIAALEADLGRPLFDRSTRPLAVTKAGAELFDVLRSGLSRLEMTVGRIRRDGAGESVTISAGAGVAAYWLTPRLEAIRAAVPEVQLRIISQSHSGDDDASGDLQVRFGEGRWPNVEISKLFGEAVIPVASPHYLAKRRAPWTVAQIKAARLLDMKVTRQPWYDWTSWFAEVDKPVSRKLDVMLFDTYLLVVTAALAGQGICLAWDGILDDLLASEALVPVSPLVAKSSRGCFVTHDRALPADAPARTIARLLVELAGSRTR